MGSRLAVAALAVTVSLAASNANAQSSEDTLLADCYALRRDGRFTDSLLRCQGAVAMTPIVVVTPAPAAPVLDASVAAPPRVEVPATTALLRHPDPRPRRLDAGRAARPATPPGFAGPDLPP